MSFQCYILLSSSKIKFHCLFCALPRSFEEGFGGLCIEGGKK